MSKVFIIAEAGVNHNGDVNVAKQLIDAAVCAGVDAIKFQTFKTELCISRKTKKATYQLESTKATESQFNMVKKLELDEATHRELLSYCNTNGIIFLSTPFDDESIELLNELEIEIFKIPSGEITNLPYLEKIGSLNKKIILSTGMSSLADIEMALKVLEKNGTLKSNIVVLHANTEYPTPMRDVNLKAMNTIGTAFNVPIGYSDHTLGIEVPIAAVAMGASVIEKHFTLDNTMEGPDHKASLEPDELTKMVKTIRNIEIALGSSIKIPTESESKNINVIRKSIVAKIPIKQGEVFSESNITIKRPGNGISPMRWHEIIGRIAEANFEVDDLIKI